MSKARLRIQEDKTTWAEDAVYNLQQKEHLLSHVIPQNKKAIANFQSSDCCEAQQHYHVSEMSNALSFVQIELPLSWLRSAIPAPAPSGHAVC